MYFSHTLLLTTKLRHVNRHTTIGSVRLIPGKKSRLRDENKKVRWDAGRFARGRYNLLFFGWFAGNCYSLDWNCCLLAVCDCLLHMSLSACIQLFAMVEEFYLKSLLSLVDDKIMFAPLYDLLKLGSIYSVLFFIFLILVFISFILLHI